MIEDISERLLREFASCLQSTLAGGQQGNAEPAADGAETVAVEPASAAPAGAAAARTRPAKARRPPAATPAPRTAAGRPASPWPPSAAAAAAGSPGESAARRGAARRGRRQGSRAREPDPYRGGPVRVPARGLAPAAPGAQLRPPQVAIEQDGGSGEPLVLVHGLATTRAIWNAVTPALALSHRVLTLDVPGFGQSPPAGDGFELDAVAERIADGLAAWGLHEGVDLVGHSLGAGVALTLAARHPASVRRLVLVAPAGLAPVARSASLALAAGVDGVLSAGVDGVLAARRRLAALTDLRWGRRLLLGLTAADPAAIAPTQARLMINASAGAQRTAAAFSTITGADLRPLLRSLERSPGVIWGERDRTVPARHADAIREARPDAEIVVLERAGHVAMVECPDAFVDALERLLTRLPKDATTPGQERFTVS